MIWCNPNFAWSRIQSLIWSKVASNLTRNIEKQISSKVLIQITYRSMFQRPIKVVDWIYKASRTQGLVYFIMDRGISIMSLFRIRVVLGINQVNHLKNQSRIIPSNHIIIIQALKIQIKKWLKCFNKLVKVWTNHCGIK